MHESSGVYLKMDRCIPKFAFAACCMFASPKNVASSYNDESANSISYIICDPQNASQNFMVLKPLKDHVFLFLLSILM